MCVMECKVTESWRTSTIDAEKREKTDESNAKPIPDCRVVVHKQGGIRVLTAAGQNLRIFA